MWRGRKNMNDYKLIQTKGRPHYETGNTIGCEWTLFKNYHPIRIFDEYTEAIMEYKILTE